MLQQFYADLAEAIIEGEEELAVSLVRQGLEQGINPLDMIQHGLNRGMNVVGDRFSCGEYFLPHLVMAGNAMKAALVLLEPALRANGVVRPTSGVVVLGTVAGDIHEIGKSLVGTMLVAEGFVVHDLGVDVPAEQFVRAVHETGANLVGLSALLTTTMRNQRHVIEALTEAGLRGRVKVMVGGAPVSQQWAEEIGADGYAEDAVGAAALARRLIAAN